MRGSRDDCFSTRASVSPTHAFAPSRSPVSQVGVMNSCWAAGNAVVASSTPLSVSTGGCPANVAYPPTSS
eukprot:2309613-Alexandrium_andersonii.AAC.1